MSSSKYLSDSGWKDIAAKGKIKDNGLLKALADYKRVDADKHDESLECLDQILKLATQLKKAKDVTAAPGAVKYIAELTDAAEADRRATAKAKAEAGKLAELEAKKDKKSGKDEDDEEEEEGSDLLTTKMIPLLRQVAKGGVMHTMIASTGKQTVVMLSRKPISPARRKLLADELGASGGVKYFVGHCVHEEGMTMFVLKTQVAGMAKKLKLALLEQTGLRVKVRCRGEDGETDEDLDEPEQRGGDEPRVARKGAGEAGGSEDEEAEKSTAASAAAPAPAAQPALAKAPDVWDDTRDILQKNIEALRKAVKAQVAGEDDGIIDAINGDLRKIDRIFARLDKRLGASLTDAAEARDAAARSAALQQSKAILTEYIKYVRSEPLIDHIDNNPFGVNTDLKGTLSRTLTQMARAIG